MGWFKSLKIGTKIIIGFAAIIVCTMTLAFIMRIANSISSDNLKAIEEYANFNEQINDFSDYYGNMRIGANALYGTTYNAGDYKYIEDEYAHVKEDLKKLSGIASGNALFSEYKDELAEIADSLVKWTDDINKLKTSQESLEYMRGQFASLGAEAYAKTIELYEGQLENIENDINAGRDAEAMHRRRNRLEHGTSLALDIGTMRRSFVRMIDFFDMNGVPQAVEAAHAIVVSLDKYISDSSQQKDIDLSESAKEALSKYIPLIDIFIDEVDNHAHLADLTKSEAAENYKLVSGILEAIASNMYDRISSSESMVSVMNTMSLIVSVLTIGAGVLFAVIITRSVTKELKTTIDKLVDISKSVRSTADQINDASNNLAAGSSEQAAAIEETSATMNETESMVAQNAENTRVASQIAASSAELTNEAGKHMANMMNSMNELIESSQKVGKIIKTIDDIAFQTNLLAINATVEAARAGGDAGRSFAVVAQEVRTLAQKSASSVTDTTEIIEKNITLTNAVNTDAVEVANLAGELSGQMGKLEKLIKEVSAASEEQASGIKQINSAVSQIEQSTQANAAIAEENSAASGELHNEVIRLDEAIEEEAKLI